MPAIIVPAGLPMPAVATLTPTERRLLTSLPGPRRAHVQQRDFNATQRIEWAVLSRAQMSLLATWWHDDLLEGGAWFAATWPLPEGLVVGVRKFLAEPAKTYLGAGKWRVSALCEVRGRGELPQGPAAVGAEIGWYDPITGFGGTVAHSNSGVAAYSEDTYPQGKFAGVVGYTGQAVVWSTLWEPLEEGATEPAYDDSIPGVFYVDWPMDGFDAFAPSQGTLTITATVDGVPVDGIVMTGMGAYTTLAWGPAP